MIEHDVADDAQLQPLLKKRAQWIPKQTASVYDVSPWTVQCIFVCEYRRMNVCLCIYIHIYILYIHICEITYTCCIYIYRNSQLHTSWIYGNSTYMYMSIVHVWYASTGWEPWVWWLNPHWQQQKDNTATWTPCPRSSLALVQSCFSSCQSFVRRSWSDKKKWKQIQFWGFPKWGRTPNHLFDGILHYKLSSYWGTSHCRKPSFTIL